MGYIGSVKVQTPVDVADWAHRVTGPGQYTITFDDLSNPALGSPYFNLYGLWASNPIAVTPFA